jgi:hypothetical protein
MPDTLEDLSYNKGTRCVRKQGHLQKELLGGHPHHHYLKACHSCPVVDRALKKTHVLLMNMLKNYLKQVSL